jgi:hypothetical protein
MTQNFANCSRVNVLYGLFTHFRLVSLPTQFGTLYLIFLYLAVLTKFFLTGGGIGQ